jgi:hypothetical protein
MDESIFDREAFVKAYETDDASFYEFFGIHLEAYK